MAEREETERAATGGVVTCEVTATAEKCARPGYMNALHEGDCDRKN